MIEFFPVITFSDTQHFNFVFFNHCICGYTETRNNAAMNTDKRHDVKRINQKTKGE